ncbi:MAG: peptide chain release factor N(5)-glutamine methyltransferase [Paracoccaceae bacterium]|nr:peptide chain release factor N(5)-glutamine methyltransferase [Paracoccaceae bacterium]MDG2259261.1 peptide chain release factor N(5)-glutamine methyltransferase [Paracoccaceae bacterium]
MNAQSVLLPAIQDLKVAGVQDPAKDARLLLAHSLGVEIGRLTLHLNDDIKELDAEQFQRLVRLRIQRQPVSQILGRRIFYGREFKVTPDVLDPRPETETLVEQALSVDFGDVLDVGTGSGCLLLTLLAERPSAKGAGVDISDAALRVAKDNVASLQLDKKAQLLRSDWFSNVDGKFDLIVSNPPYIDEDEWLTLEPEPRVWEPKIALTPGPDGLMPYRILADGSARYLNDGGWLMVEIGWQQGDAVKMVFEHAGWRNVEIKTDMGGCDRVVRGQKP